MSLVLNLFICLVFDCIGDWKGGGEYFPTSNKFISSSKAKAPFLLLNSRISSPKKMQLLGFKNMQIYYIVSKIIRQTIYSNLVSHVIRINIVLPCDLQQHT